LFCQAAGIIDKRFATDQVLRPWYPLKKLLDGLFAKSGALFAQKTCPFAQKTCPVPPKGQRAPEVKAKNREHPLLALRLLYWPNHSAMLKPSLAEEYAERHTRNRPNDVIKTEFTIV